ncbi:hypothetical protein BH23VER1_BH23VER1_09750 [soil metagenome]
MNFSAAPRRVTRALAWSSFLFLAISVARAAPVITEFQAINSSTLVDEDDDRSDWIEIFNPDPAAADLTGYYLTDDSADLTKWQFPATTLAPSGFLVVFASGKDRAVAGSELHTNFRLTSEGEYLALVAPDGVTVVHAYAPSFPVQFEDVSYGLAQLGDSSDETVIPEGALATALVPTDGTLGASWTQPGFDDSGWLAGTTGVGYERNSGYEDFIGIDVEAQMFGSHTSVYLRVPFSVTGVDEIVGLELQIQYDDGFVAYLNGIEVARDRAPTNADWQSGATADHTDGLAEQFLPFGLDGFTGALVEGENVLAIHGLNNGSGSSDMLVQPRLVATRLSDASLGGPGYFLVPTPGAVNGVEHGLPGTTVTISEPSKTFTSPFQVALGGAEAGQTLRFTLDGSVPAPSSPAYTNPISISGSTQIRARVFGENNEAGPISMESYLFLGADVANFSSNLPIVVLENWGGGKPTGDKDGFWAIIEPDAEGDNRSHMGAPLHIATRCNMRVRGSSSAGFAKYSLALESQDEAKEDASIRPLGMPNESDWVLSGRYEFDRALMRNPLIYRLSNETGEYAVRTRFVEVFLNVGGGNLSYADDYFGVYTLMEKIKRDDDRVDIDKLLPSHTAEPEVTGGYVWKKDRLDPGDSGFSVNRMGTFGWVEPKEEEVVPAQVTWLRNHLNAFDAALYNSNWTHPTAGLHFTEYIDVGSWLRHHWLNTLAMNVDGFRLSGFYYKHRDGPKGGKVGAGPIWDFDRSMESTDGRDNNPLAWDGTGDSSMTYGDSRFPWWGRALTNPDFRQAHTDLWQDLRDTTFSTANIHGVIDEFVDQLDFQDPTGTNPGRGRSPQARNFNKWTSVPPRGGYGGEISILKNWLAARANWIDSQYTARPSFSVPPGPVAAGTGVGFDGGGGTVYYTTDGTDPRAPGGGVSPAASTTPPVAVGETTVITARARSGTGLTAWSGPIQGTYLVGPLAAAGNLVISELHYAPAPPATASELAASEDAGDFEFVELLNVSPTDTIDLTDAYFARGIDFSFAGAAVTALAPGERVLIVSDAAAFAARYGTGFDARIAGEFGPSRLDNAGERLHLVDALGETILDFTYGNAHPWPGEARDSGYSLVLITDGTSAPDPSSPSNWRTSTTVGGNPNASDSTPLSGDPQADDDHDSLKKLLEHALGTSDLDGADGRQAYGAAIMTVAVDGTDTEYFTLWFQRDLAADDVDLHVEVSDGMTGWDRGDSAVEFVDQTNHGDGTATLTYRSKNPVSAEEAPRIFMRLVAEER